MITRSRLLKFSLCQAIIAAAVFVINYFFYHFVTDDGITLIWQAEPGKPFVANLIGFLGVLFIFGAAVSLIAAFIFFDKNKSEDK
jgi:hypothetical protein